MQTNLWKHQLEAIEKSELHNKCLINMFCGTGKTRVIVEKIFKTILDSNNLNVIVFPSLPLINQFNNDYILDDAFKSKFSNFQCLSFCSDSESKLKIKSKHIRYTTSESVLSIFLKKNTKKIISVTYASYVKFISVIKMLNINIDRLYYDESHHICSDTIKDIIIDDSEYESLVNKTEFYTATPISSNGVSMISNNQGLSNCGFLAYEYLYYQALQDGICNEFDTNICLYTNKLDYTNKFQPIFEFIIRSCLSNKHKYWNILTYHNFVNITDNDSNNITYVKDFSSDKNVNLFKKLFCQIQKNEFPHTSDTFNVNNIIMKGIHSDTKKKEIIIKDFDRQVDGRIYLLASCCTLNEGIDTKYANMMVPLNPSNSITKETQRLGRIVRKPDSDMYPSKILIPCFIDTNKYLNQDNSIDKNKLIKEELNDCGNFNTCLAFISSLKYQYNPEFYNLCLKYPSSYSPKEVCDNFMKYNCYVENSPQDLVDIINEELSTNYDKDTEILLENVAIDNSICIELHTQEYTQPIKYYNEEFDNINTNLRIFFNKDIDKYFVINGEKNKIKSPIKRKKLFNIQLHNDLELVWNINEKDIDFEKEFNIAILDCEINYLEKEWLENLEKLVKFVEDNGKIPTNNKNNLQEKQSEKWLSHQKQNYKNNVGILQVPYIKKEFENFMNKFSNLMLSNLDKLVQNLQEIEDYIKNNDKLPPQHHKDIKIDKLAKWLSKTRKNYNEYKEGMKFEKNRELFKKFLEKYNEYFIDNKTKWNNTFEEFKKYVEKHKKIPSTIDVNKAVQKLGNWYSLYLDMYKKNKCIMKEKEYRIKWNEYFSKSPYLSDQLDLFKKNIIASEEYIKNFKKRPPSCDKDKKIRILGQWLQAQSINYKKNVKTMNTKNKEIRSIWEKFINDNKDLFPTQYEEICKKNPDINGNKNQDNELNYEIKQWYINMDKLKEYIQKYKKKPSNPKDDINIRKISGWLYRQISNYEKKIRTMEPKNKQIVSVWENFINDNKNLFPKQYEEICKNNPGIKSNEDKKYKKTIIRNDKEYRESVRELYDRKCLITNYSYKRCEVCHIKPFCESAPEEQYNIYNGILLDCSLHKLFDLHLFSIDPVTKTVVTTKDEELGLEEINGKKLENIPNESIPFLENHFNKFKKNNIVDI